MTTNHTKRKQKVFKTGKYPAQFTGIHYYVKSGRRMARLRFLVYNNEIEDYESFATNNTYPGCAVEKFIKDKYGASPAMLMHAGFLVELGLTEWGQNTIEKWERYPKFTVPEWARKIQDQWQKQEGVDDYRKSRKKKDKRFMVAERIRERTRQLITGEGEEFDLIGCDRDTLREYLESQFKGGMTWSKWGGKDGWNVDHKFPLSRCRTAEDFRRAAHYTNLQPLWAKENVTKYNNV